MTSKEALDSNPNAVEIHINEMGEWLFCPKEGVHESFGAFETYTSETIPTSSIEDVVVKKTKKNN